MPPLALSLTPSRAPLSTSLHIRAWCCAVLFCAARPPHHVLAVIMSSGDPSPQRHNQQLLLPCVCAFVSPFVSPFISHSTSSPYPPSPLCTSIQFHNGLPPRLSLLPPSLLGLSHLTLPSPPQPLWQFPPSMWWVGWSYPPLSRGRNGHSTTPPQIYLRELTQRARRTFTVTSSAARRRHAVTFSASMSRSP